MKLIYRVVSAVALLFACAMPAFADKCTDRIVDELDALTGSDRAAIEKSLGVLSQKGADVHVLVVDSFHRNVEGNMNKSLDEYKSTMKQKCPTWQAPGGGMKNNLILIVVAPKQKQSLLANGDQWQSAIEPIRARIYSDTMNPRFREGRVGDGVAKALDDVVDVTSIKPSQIGKPVTINHATDLTGLWTTLKWVLLLVVLGGLGFLGYWVFRQRESRRGAQRNAQTERGKCAQSLNSFDGTFAVLGAKVGQAKVSTEWKARINRLLGSAKREYDSASGEFSALDRSANNPDTPRLSVEEYAKMEQRFAELAGKFARAYELLGQASGNLTRAENGELLVVKEVAAPSAPQNHSARNANQAPRSTPQSAQSSGGVQGGSSGQQTGNQGRGDRVVVVHDDSGPGFMTGVIVGNILSDHGHNNDYRDRYPQQRDGSSDPVICTPTFESPPTRESDGGGKASDWGTTSDGGGKAVSFGETTGGGGSASNWDNNPGNSSSATSY